MRRALRWAEFAWLIGVPLAHAAAQEGRRGTITGIVRRSLDSIPVSKAVVTLDSSSAQSITDSSGTFAFHGIAPGAHQVQVRKVGYAAATISTILSDDGQTRVAVMLQPSAQPLTTMLVSGRTIAVPSRYAGIAERANRNNGALFTAQDIAREFPQRTRDLLQRLPGVSVNDRSVTFARCQDSGMLPGPMGGGNNVPPRVQVYVDGVRQTLPGFNNVSGILDAIHPNAIELMEVYTGIGRIPGEYVNDACAVIAIWTKSY